MADEHHIEIAARCRLNAHRRVGGTMHVVAGGESIRWQLSPLPRSPAITRIFSAMTPSSPATIEFVALHG